MDVIPGTCPGLLSVGFLNDLKMNLSMPKRSATFEAIEVSVPVLTMPSGHIGISVIDFPDTGFEIPDELDSDVKRFALCTATAPRAS